jgi:hypothetical protein
MESVARKKDRSLAERDPRARKFPDRKLGASWYGWDGGGARHEASLNEGPRLYFLLLLAELVVVTLILVVDGWFLTQVVFRSVSIAASRAVPVATVIVIVVIGAPLASWWHAWFFCVLAVAARSRYLAFPWFSRWLTLQVPFLAWCARPFGLSRDRIGSSCVAITNMLARLQLRAISAVRPLVLLPRCLTPETVRSIKEIAAERDCPVMVVGANKQARDKVREFRPTAIVAVACERDLVSGLYDFGHKLPILVLANDRPFGPCLKASVNLERLREALRDIHAAAQKHNDNKDNKDKRDEKDERDNTG